MSDNARRFLDAFARIEEELTNEQSKRRESNRWHSFTDMVRHSTLLRPREADTLIQFAKLRNAIVHAAYLDGEPLADPRIEVIGKIESILQMMTEPPLLVEVLADRPRPRILTYEDSLGDFLALVRQESFSQVPVRTRGGWSLLTTNVLARWFASHNEGLPTGYRSLQIERLLEFSEPGDSIVMVNRGATAVSAIRILAGDENPKVEPPAAVMVRGKPGEGPALLCTRADLAALHSAIRPE